MNWKEDREHWHGAPGLPSKVVKIHPRTKLVWALEGLLASPWIIPFAWTPSLPFLNVWSDSSLFYYMLLSSRRETGFSLTILGHECLKLALQSNLAHHRFWGQSPRRKGLAIKCFCYFLWLGIAPVLISSGTWQDNRCIQADSRNSRY